MSNPPNKCGRPGDGGFVLKKTASPGQRSPPNRSYASALSVNSTSLEMNMEPEQTPLGRGISSWEPPFANLFRRCGGRPSLEEKPQGSFGGWSKCAWFLPKGQPKWVWMFNQCWFKHVGLAPQNWWFSFCSPLTSPRIAIPAQLVGLTKTVLRHGSVQIPIPRF